MSEPLNIDLSGIEDMFFASGRMMCADCGRDFDRADSKQEGPISEENPDDSRVPLLLWKDDGKLMLTLCWPCATKRMKPATPPAPLTQKAFPA